MIVSYLHKKVDRPFPQEYLLSLHLARGQAFLFLGQAQKALLDFDILIQKEPEFFIASLYRGNAYLSLKKYKQAIADFDQTIRLAPNFYHAFSNRGVAHSMLKEHQKAIADFDQAILLAPQNVAAYIQRGRALAQSAEYDRAIADFERAIELDPNNAEAYLGRGGTFYEQGEYRQAIVEYDQAIALNPDNNAAYYVRSLAQVKCKEYEQALKDLNWPVEPRPKNARVDKYPDVPLVLGDHDQLYRYFNRVLPLEPPSKYAFASQRGLVLSYLGRYAEAIENYKLALSGKTEELTTLYNIAVAKVRWKGLAEAKSEINVARKALVSAQKTTDSRGSALYGLGGLEALTGNADQALNYLEQALSIDEEVIDWARDDIAWLDLRDHPRFQALVPPRVIK